MTTQGEETVPKLIEWLGNWFETAGADGATKLTSQLHPYDRLFSPIAINHLQIRNRLIMGPMGNASMVEETGRPSGKMIAYFEARARGGVGLITSGLVPISPESDPAIP